MTTAAPYRRLVAVAGRGADAAIQYPAILTITLVVGALVGAVLRLLA